MQVEHVRFKRHAWSRSVIIHLQANSTGVVIQIMRDVAYAVARNLTVALIAFPTL